MAWRRQARQDRSGGGEVGTIRRHRLLHMAVRHRSVMVGGVILLRLLCRVNAALVTRGIAAGPGCRPCRHAPRSWRDRCVNATPQHTPSVTPLAAPLVCLTDSSWSRLDTVDRLPPWHHRRVETATRFATLNVPERDRSDVLPYFLPRARASTTASSPATAALPDPQFDDDRTVVGDLIPQHAPSAGLAGAGATPAMRRSAARLAQ
jgi:hypothetical protein